MKAQIIVVIRDGEVQEIHGVGESVEVAVLDYDKAAKGDDLVTLHDTGLIDPERDQDWIGPVEAEEAAWADWLAQGNYLPYRGSRI